MNMVFAETGLNETLTHDALATIPEGLRLAQAPMKSATANDVDVRRLASIAVTAFRAHNHICNVLTHISGAKWDRVEETLCVILDPRTGQRELTPLAENILDLLCGNRGVTGRILKPYFELLLLGTLPADVATQICGNVGRLFKERRGRATGQVS
ncbi:MAG: hypothetical protein K9G30_06250 [Parvibaculum sp.]|nr:hypothetical protein [Parvibaculum sp.]